jgi:hypothetical protein
VKVFLAAWLICSAMDYPIIDGFTLKTNLRCNLTFRSMAIQQYESLRRSRAFRTKAWCIPADSSVAAIPAFDSLEYQVYMKPGSAIWGYTFTGFGNNNLIDSFQITESCTNVPLFSEFVTKQPEDNAQQQYLSCLLIVPAPGLLNVEIATTQAVDRKRQLILWGGEPV